MQQTAPSYLERHTGGDLTEVLPCFFSAVSELAAAPHSNWNVIFQLREAALVQSFSKFD